MRRKGLRLSGVSKMPDLEIRATGGRIRRSTLHFRRADLEARATKADKDVRATI